MAIRTNELVGKLKQSVLPASVSCVLALSAVMLVNHGAVHASAVTASALDDNSVAALTSLDRAMETVAARVSPAVVNIAVTSRASEQETADEEGQSEQGGQGQGMQGVPPEFRRFFGQGSGESQPQQMQHGIGSGVISRPMAIL